MTSGDHATVARATAVVFVDGQRAGSGGAGRPRCLLTAAHVLLHLDPGTLAKVPVEQVELEFPGREPGGQSGRAAASRVDPGPASLGVDVARAGFG